jgi:hypothetical protein
MEDEECRARRGEGKTISYQLRNLRRTLTTANRLTMSSSYIRKAGEFIKVVNQLEKHPGFGLALGFSSLHVRAEQFQFEDKTLKIKLPLTSSLLWSDSKTSNVGLLSTFAALIDETTSLALVVADPSRGRPGVSVVLSVEVGPGLTALTVGDEVEIISHVQRTGRNLGFTKAEIRSVPTGQLICTGSHIKFLNNYGRLGNFFLSSYGWPFFKGYGDVALKDPAKELSMSQSLPELFASLENWMAAPSAFGDHLLCLHWELPCTVVHKRSSWSAPLRLLSQPMRAWSWIPWRWSTSLRPICNLY